MNSPKSLVRSLGAVAVAGLLSACAGGMSAPQTSSNALPFAGSQMQPSGSPIQPAKCKSDHGVSVNPCSMSLSPSNPEETATTKGPKGGTFSFNDTTCVKNGIATISGSGNTYLVVWGSKNGSCTAVFTDKNSKGKKIGIAKLAITNKA